MELNYVNYFNEFEKEFERLKNASEDVLTISIEIIQYIENKLKEIYKWLKKHIFETPQEEIYFFKELKPRMVSKLLFYKELLKLEASLPPNKKNKRKHYEDLLTKINRYAVSNREFYEYYRSRTSFKDEDLFVRRSYKNIFLYDCYLINYDSKLSTSHDFNVAIIISNDMLSSHLENKIDELYSKTTSNKPPMDHKFNWTGTKVDMTEVVYACQATGCINNGNFDLKEFAVFLGTMLNMEIDANLYGNYSDIKSRKIPKTRFLNMMSDKLIEKIDIEDSKKKPL